MERQNNRGDKKGNKGEDMGDMDNKMRDKDGKMGEKDNKIKLDRKYVKEGVTLFLVGVALLTFHYVITNIKSLTSTIGKINDILFPIYLGIILAFLLTPTYNWVVRNYLRLNPFKTQKERYRFIQAQFVGSVAALLVIGIFVTGFLGLVIPDLWGSIKGLRDGLPDAIERVQGWINKNLNENPELRTFIEGRLDDLSDTGVKWIQNSIIPGAEVLMNGVIGTLGTIIDIFVALIICVYILTNKETFIAQGRKLVLVMFKKERAEDILDLGSLINTTFGGFVNGKIIDSLIIGAICFVAMTVLRLPLPMLISVIVCITNVIPFFGPFIGAIPSIFILLIISPIASLKFAVMVLVLQQVDGNIIGPKILGKTTRLASFWVMFAIILGGGLFGFLGMILGVPVFAIAYFYIGRAVNKKLRRKGYPTDTALYQTYDKYGMTKEDIYGKERFKNSAEYEEKIKSIIESRDGRLLMDARDRDGEAESQ